MNWQQQLMQQGSLSEQEPLAPRTTFGIGGPARWFFAPVSIEALAEAMPSLPADMPRLVLGRGSNLLVSDDGFDGLVVDLSAINAIRVEGQKLYAEAGARMSKIAQHAASAGLAGLEFMATVPGDLGGGVAMNAGAFGQQVSDTLTHIEVVLTDGSRQQLERDQLAMRYRHTELPAGAIIVSATFALATGDVEALRERMRSMRQQRSDTQPLAMPNCGSVFKNPPGDHAARLIEAVGLKGLRHGQACISSRHANFIVNEGHASAADVLALIRAARAAVKEQFGVELEPEVRILGEQP
jgi:UDP-N-acetylmuramate dehydrogenase